jgi:putative phage-type endonuclease
MTSVTSSLTPEQVAQRRSYIGGSDAAAVLGIDQFRSPLDIYLVKIGEKQPDPPTAAMKRGIVLEPIARKLYAELTGRKVRRLAQRVHPSYDFMGCMVDGEIVGDERGRGVLEIKSPGVWNFAKVKREGLPLSWISQMAHNLEVTGFSWGSYAIFNADLWEMVHFDLVRDEELARALVMAEHAFWYNNVLARVPPTAKPDLSPELVAQLARAQGDTPGELLLRNDSEWGSAAQTYIEAKSILETGEHLVAVAKDRLKALMGEKGAIEGGGLRVYWSDRDGRKSFDRKALEASGPLDRIAVATAINQRVMHDATKDALLADIGRCDVDFRKFEKVGNSYEDFRAYQLRSVGVGD